MRPIRREAPPDRPSEGVAVQEELPVIIKWTEFLDWFIGVTEKFPKNVRWSLTSRLENHAYDILEQLLEAKFETASPRKWDRLREINLRLDLMRFLLRHSHKRRFLARKAYEKSNRDLAEVGRMVGGWMRAQKVQ